MSLQSSSCEIGKRKSVPESSQSDSKEPSEHMKIKMAQIEVERAEVRRRNEELLRLEQARKIAEYQEQLEE